MIRASHLLTAALLVGLFPQGAARAQGRPAPTQVTVRGAPQVTAQPAQPAAGPVRGEVLIVLASEQPGPVDPALASVPELVSRCAQMSPKSAVFGLFPHAMKTPPKPSGANATLCKLPGPIRSSLAHIGVPELVMRDTHTLRAEADRRNVAQIAPPAPSGTMSSKAQSWS